MRTKITAAHLVMFAIILMMSACAKGGPKISNYSQEQLRAEARTALHSLYASTPETRKLRDQSVGILVFPDVLRAGFIIGGSGGNGVLFSPTEKEMGYYNLASASVGLQAGAQGYTQVMFLMTQEAMNHLNSTNGWSLGVGPTIVVVDAGAARDLSTTTARYDVFAFIHGQRGLMGGIGVVGQKITRLRPQ